MNDDELQKHFDALRELDQANAPRIHALLVRRPKRSVAVWPWALGAGLTAISVPFAVVLFMLLPRPDRTARHELVAPVEIYDSEPLAFLLEPIPELEEAP